MIKIVNLTKEPHFARIAANWSYFQWNKERKIPYNAILRDYERRVGKSEFPLTFVALKDNFPVGMVSLKQQELKADSELDLWLSALFVVPEFRSQGIAKLLIEHAIAQAKKRLFKELYLFVSSPTLKNYYQKRGWNFFKNSKDNEGKFVIIMKYTIKEHKNGDY